MRPLSPAIFLALWALESASGCTRRNPLYELGTASSVDAGIDTVVVGGQDDARDETEIGSEADDAGLGDGGTGGVPSGDTDAAGSSDEDGSNGDAGNMGGFVDGPLDSGQVDLAPGPASAVPDVASGSGCLASNPHNCGAGGGIGSITVNYTVSGGSNNFIVVGVAATTSIDATGVTYRGATLPALTSVSAAGGCKTQLFGGVPVAPGPADVARASGSGAMSIQVFSFVNVDGSSLGNSNSAEGATTTMMVPVVTAQAQVVVDYGCIVTSGSPVITVTNNSTVVNISKQAPAPLILAAGSWRLASASPGTTTTASYAVSGSTLSWKIVAIALKPLF